MEALRTSVEGSLGIGNPEVKAALGSGEDDDGGGEVEEVGGGENGDGGDGGGDGGEEEEQEEQEAFHVPTAKAEAP